MAMNDRQVRRLEPKYNRFKEELNPANVHFDYNELSDTLYIYMFPGDQPLVVIPSRAGLTSFLVDPESEEILGLQLEGFLDRWVVDHPKLISVAEIAGIDSKRIESARDRIGDARWREAVISSTIQDLIAEVDRSIA